MAYAASGRADNVQRPPHNTPLPPLLVQPPPSSRPPPRRWLSASSPFLSLSHSLSASIVPSSSRKRPLPADAASGPMSAAGPPTARVKVERGGGRGGGRDGERGGATDSWGHGALPGDSGRTADRRRESVPAAATAPFVSIRAVRQQARQLREEAEAEEGRAAARVEAAQGGGGDSDSGVELDNGRSSVPFPAPAAASAPPPAVVVVERLCRPPAPPSAPPPASPVAASGVNFKRFHKTPLGHPSPYQSVPPAAAAARSYCSAPRVVVADSGEGCRAAGEVEEVRQAERIERLTAQMDDSSGYGHTGRGSSIGTVTGKRKR